LNTKALKIGIHETMKEAQSVLWDHKGLSMQWKLCRKVSIALDEGEGKVDE
jgi:hypothetical protein